MKTLLFFDDWYLESYSNIRIKMGKPKWIEEATFADPGYVTSANYPSVFWDEKMRRWRAFYQARTREYIHKSTNLLATAESDDGIHWHVPDLNMQFQDPERKIVNEVFPAGRGPERGCVYLDQRETGLERRYKLMYAPGPKMYVAFSSDGYRWKQVPDVSWGDWLSDTAMVIYYNKHRDSYVTVCRQNLGDRRPALVETRDWRTWSKPQVVVHPDPLDPPLVQFYGMPTFPYEEMYVGFLWVFHCDPHQIPADTSKYHGPIDSQLTYSYDGWHFNRTFREPFIARNEPGLPGCGSIYSCSLCIDEQNIIRIYSAGHLYEHGRGGWEENGSLLLHTLRLDGFMYLESTSNLARVMTRCLLFHEPMLKINVQAPQGEVRVQLSDEMGKPLTGFSFDDCIPFKGDELFWEPQWHSGKTLKDALNRPVRVEAQMAEARLYAIRGAFDLLDYTTYVRRFRR